MLGHLVYNGHDFGERFFCYSPKRLMPDVEVSNTVVSGRDGAYFKSRRLKPFDIECTLVMRDPKGDDEHMVEVLHEVSSVLLEEEAKLYLPTDDERYYIATPSGTSSVDEFVTSARLRLKFRICDPFKHGDSRSVELTTSSKSVEVGGTYRARPVVTAHPDSGANLYRIKNVTTGEQVVLYPNKVDTSDTWNGTETIEIDMWRETAAVNGQQWPVSLSSDYWLMSGTTSISANTGTTTVEWEEMWL